MPKYQYHTCVGKFTPGGEMNIWVVNDKIKSMEKGFNASEYFNRLGEEGWELIQAYVKDQNHFYVFRRVGQ